MSLLIRVSYFMFKVINRDIDVCSTSMYLSVRLPDFEYASDIKGGGPRVVVSSAAFHARVRGSVFGGLKETQNVSSPFTCETHYCGGWS